ncbi:hypothetical protein L0244_28095 [bacterium]|nr:hypothetical protein [bacterium]
MNRLSIVIVVIFVISLFPAAYAKKSTEVQISAPLRPKYVAKGYKKLFICDFIITGTLDVDKVVNININKEIKETLKTEFKDKSGYDVEDLKVEFDKTKKPDEILKDPAFWMAQDIGKKEGTMILAGSVDFSNKEKSGLITERVTNPRTGVQRDVTTTKERLQLILGVNLYLIDGTNGEKLFQENFREEEVYDDIDNVSLPLFYDVFERMTPKIVGILVPYRVAGSRTLLEP